MTEIYPIVGAHYRPPAKALIAVLAIGTPLTVRAEPENPVDGNACAIWLKTADIGENAWDELAERLAGYGHTVENILAQEEWHLGYIPKDVAAVLRANDFIKVGEDKIGHFSCGINGMPRINFED